MQVRAKGRKGGQGFQLPTQVIRHGGGTDGHNGVVVVFLLMTDSTALSQQLFGCCCICFIVITRHGIGSAFHGRVGASQ